MINILKWGQGQWQRRSVKISELPSAAFTPCFNCTCHHNHHSPVSQLHAGKKLERCAVGHPSQRSSVLTVAACLFCDYATDAIAVAVSCCACHHHGWLLLFSKGFSICYCGQSAVLSLLLLCCHPIAARCNACDAIKASTVTACRSHCPCCRLIVAFLACCYCCCLLSLLRLLSSCLCCC